MRLLLVILIIALSGCATHGPDGWYDKVDVTIPIGHGADEFTNKYELGYQEYLASVDPKALEWPVDKEVAYRVLAITDEFAGTDIGHGGGGVSFQSDCLNALIREDDAADIFNSLVERGALPGQLYAMCGLYLTDRRRFNELAPRYRFKEAIVSEYSGCVASEVEVAELFSRIANGAYPRDFLFAEPGGGGVFGD